MLRYRCGWDDGHTSPPSPVFNAGQCLNAVVGVHYELQWYGGRIIHVNATLTLTNVSLVTNYCHQAAMLAEPAIMFFYWCNE